MRRLCVEKVALMAALVGAAMTSGHSAFAAAAAQGGVSVGAGVSVGNKGASANASAQTTTTTTTTTTTPAAAPAPAAQATVVVTPAPEKSDKEKDDDRNIVVGIDLVVGSARSTSLTATAPPDAQNGLPGQYSTANSRVTAYSFILDGALLVTPDFLLGVAVPLEGGTIYALPNRSTGAVGNIELLGGGRLHLARNVALDLGLAVTLPTAQGSQIPGVTSTLGSVQLFNQDNYDRWTVQRATSATRGYLDDELYEPDHLGINPQIKLRLGGEKDGWHLDPWIKLNDLIATDSAYKFIGELVFGGDLGWFATRAFEPGVKVWANAPFTGGDFTTVGVVDPELRFHFGNVRAALGAILPFAGPITNPYAVGIEGSLGGRF